MSAPRGACYGQSPLFDSTVPEDHLAAATICATCPVIDACRLRLAETLAAAKSGGGPVGTWAGELLGGRPQPECGSETAYQWHRHHEPDRTCGPCRLAHARFEQARRAQRLAVAS